MRLYYYPKDGGRVRTWPIGIGRLEYETPLGKTSVVGKKVGPVWYPTDTIREEYAARGEPLPRMVLPGPDNPLGSHAIYLGLPTYLIHGTNRPYSIGMRVSFGCVRLYPEDIVELYDLVAPGTPVRLVDERVKAGWLEDEIYLEAHPNPDLPQEEARPNMTDAVRAIIRATPDGRRPPVDWEARGGNSHHGERDSPPWSAGGWPNPSSQPPATTRGARPPRALRERGVCPDNRPPREPRLWVNVVQSGGLLSRRMRGRNTCAHSLTEMGPVCRYTKRPSRSMTKVRAGCGRCDGRHGDGRGRDGGPADSRHDRVPPAPRSGAWFRTSRITTDIPFTIRPMTATMIAPSNAMGRGAIRRVTLSTAM